MTDERKLEIVRQFKEEIYKRFNLNVMSDENLETVIEQMIVEKLGSEYITIRGTRGYHGTGIQFHSWSRCSGQYYQR